MNQTEITDSSGHVTILQSAVIGPPGPPGPPGGGTGSGTYEHNQASPSALWTINHNLGFRPSITLLTTGGVEFEAEIGHVSENQAVATLTQPLAGMARCN